VSAANEAVLAARVATVPGIHRSYETEAELWVDGPGAEEHAERFPECTPATCEGHTVPMLVCNECGHDHDGDTALLRAWPCPTVVALTGTCPS
jgi:rubrerythrin